LMMFGVTASLILAKGLATNPDLKGSVGAIGAVNGYSDPKAIGAVFSYLLIVGLLWVSMLVASRLSTAAGSKFAWSGMGRSISAVLGGSSRVLGVAGRYSLGNAGDRMAASLKAKIAEQGYATAGQRARLGMYNRLGKNSYELANTKAVQAAVKGVGGSIKDSFAKGGIMQTRKDKAEAALKQSKEAGPSEDDRKAAIKAEKDKATKQLTQQREAVAAQKQEAEADKKRAAQERDRIVQTHRSDEAQRARTESAKTARDAHQNELDVIARQRNNASTAYESNIRSADARIASARQAGDQAELAAALAARTSIQTTYDAQIASLAQEEQRHRQGITDRNAELNTLAAEAQRQADEKASANQVVQAAEQRVQQLATREQELTGHITNVGNAAERVAADSRPDVAERAQQFSRWFGSFYGGRTKMDPASARTHPVARHIKEVKKKFDAKENANHLMHALHEAAGHPPGGAQAGGTAPAEGGGSH
jgi:hypothetical protein